MDPKAVMEFRGLEEYWDPIKFSTKAHLSGGKTPTWNEVIDVRLRLDNTQLNAKSGVVFSVMDEDVKNHDIVGETAPITFNELVSATDKAKVTTLKLLY